MLNFDNLVIDRVLFGIAEDIETGEILYKINQISDFSISNTSESKDSNDAQGILIKRFYTAKSVEVSATCALLSLNMLGEQFGTQKHVASSTSKIKMPRFVSFTTTAGQADFTLPEAPLVDPTAIYEINANGTLGKKFTADASTASADKFVYASAEHKITLPTGLAEGTTLFVKYEYESENGVSVEQRGDKFPRTVKLTLSVLVADPCTVGSVRQAYIVFPSFQLSPDVDIQFTTDATFEFAGNAQVDYCSTTKRMYYITLSEDDIYSEE